MGIWLGLGSCLLAGCHDDSYLLGAVCYRDPDCGQDQCCAGPRCRPRGDCDRAPRAEEPFIPAYMACEDDAVCRERGMPHCARWRGAVGFCTDYCAGDPGVNCDRHPEGAPTRTLPRTCVEVDEQSVCALDCRTDECPGAMACLDGVCVPSDPP